MRFQSDTYWPAKPAIATGTVCCVLPLRYSSGVKKSFHTKTALSTRAGKPEGETYWAEALLKVADDPELRADLVRKGRERAARFTWERSARAILTAIEKACR